MSLQAVVAYPGAGAFAQQVALAFAEREALQAFLTTTAYRSDGKLDALLGRLGEPGARVQAQLRRRSIDLVPQSKMRTRPAYEVLRTIASRAGASSVWVDRIWDLMAHDFDQWVARAHVSGAGAIYAYEYTAHESFILAGRAGVMRILDLPSLDSRAFEALSRDQMAYFPALRRSSDAYFERKFSIRQARRDSEREMADIIVANSRLTKASHVRAGADPTKFVVTPLAAPPCIEGIQEGPKFGALRVVWAGNFSIGKGAHVLLEAMRGFSAISSLSIQVFGGLGLPEAMLQDAPDIFTWMGSVAQATLFDAFQQADVLVFPTLSDGFGMVVPEAFSRGLPVITTDQAGAADLVRHGENGLLVPAGDAKALADALHWCLDNRSVLREMRHQALRTAQDWQWPAYRQALMAGIETALQRSGRTLGTGLT